MRYFQVGLLLSVTVLLAAGRIIETPNGKVRGAVLRNYYAFTNLRYAERPVRFEPAVPYERSWGDDVFNATEEIVNCVQFGKRTNITDGQEDCLVMNVFAPRAASETNPLPVLIYIPGGAFMFGSSSFYSPEELMEQGGMVVATFNYRVGPFGFLSTGDELIQGNLGLKDQLLALRWIKTNIHLFGGDPEKMLLSGQSAGGASVHLHMLRQETEELVAAAASLSGTALNPWVIQKNPRQKAETLANLVGCPLSGLELKTCLQQRPVEEIRAAVEKMQGFLDNPFNVFGPIIESAELPGTFITEDPRTLIKRGEIVNIPWMASFVTEEGAYNAGSLLEKNDDGVEYIEELNSRWFELAPSLLYYENEPSEQVKHTMSESLKAKYMGEERFSRDSYLLLQKMFSDVLYINGIRETIQLHRMYGRHPVFGYVYGNPHNYGVGNFLAKDLEYQFGATHGDDEQLLMPLTLDSSYRAGKNDKTIARLLIEMLESFLLEGTPRFGGTNLPENGNNERLMEYLQIFAKDHCVGPWENFRDGRCEQCACYDYPDLDGK